MGPKRAQEGEPHPTKGGGPQGGSAGPWWVRTTPRHGREIERNEKCAAAHPRRVDVLGDDGRWPAVTKSTMASSSVTARNSLIPVERKLPGTSASAGT